MMDYQDGYSTFIIPYSGHMLIKYTRIKRINTYESAVMDDKNILNSPYWNKLAHMNHYLVKIK